MAYRIGSHAQRIEFPECPEAYLMIRPIGQDYLDKLAELQTEARVRLGLEPEADLPPAEGARCNFTALTGTAILGWGGWESKKDGRPLEGAPGALDPADLAEILGGDDPYIQLWYRESSDRVMKEYLDRLTYAVGKSAPLPDGNGHGAEEPAN